MSQMASGEHPPLDFPQALEASEKVRAEPASFSDHYSQARLFYLSLTAQEQAHVQQAYSFELGKCADVAVRQRQVDCLANIDEQLAATVAGALGLEAQRAPADLPQPQPSAALSQIGARWPVDGRNVAVIFIEQIAGQSNAHTSFGFDQGNDLRGILRLGWKVGDGNVGSLTGKGDGHCGADTRITTGDQSLAALEPAGADVGGFSMVCGRFKFCV